MASSITTLNHGSDPLGFMTHLSPHTFIYQPQNFTPTSPTIILCTWMNAAPVHIAFYLRKYQELFPSARLILVRGIIPNMVYTPVKSQERDLAPVLAAIDAEPDSPVLFHLFSNSGAQSASTLLRAYQHPSSTGHRRLPVKGILLDSTPSNGTYSNAYAGIAFEVTRLPVWTRPPGYLLCHLLVCLYLIFEIVTGRKNVLTQSFDDLNDDALVAKEVPRVYFYSRADMLVRWQAVERHAAVAREKGSEVQMEEFVGTGHCRHGKGEGEVRYWSVVDQLMRRNVQQA